MLRERYVERDKSRERDQEREIKIKKIGIKRLGERD